VPNRPLPAACRSRLPDGVAIQPRAFAFEKLDEVPQYWFDQNPILTHVENAFSILIPPGERFFIRSVRHFEERASDPEQRALIRAFVQQEGLHSRAHQDFNAALSRHGIDVERELAEADRAIARLERWLPARMRLGATVFLEHLTATGAHTLFAAPWVADLMHPEMARFWRWHAVEELEHKAVAFDLLREVGGGYLLRVFSAIAAVALLAFPFDRMVRRMIRDAGEPITKEMRREARALNRKIGGAQLRMLGQYFKPGFHPWDCDDEPHLRGWYASPEASALSPR